MALPLFVWIELTRPPRLKPALVPVRVSTLVRLPALLKLVVCPAAVVTLFPPPGRFTVPGVFAPATAPVRAGAVLPVERVVFAAPVFEVLALPRLFVFVELFPPRVVVFAPPRVAPPVAVVFVPPRFAPPAALVFVPPRGVVLLGAPPRRGAAFG